MLSGLSLGVLAAFFWSITNLFDKYLVSKYTREGKFGGIFLLSCFFPALLLPISFIFSKTILTSFFEILLLVSTGILMAVWIYAYLRALEIEDTSIVMSLLLFAPVFSLIMGDLILQEVPTGVQILSIIVIMCGAFVLSFNFSKKVLKKQLILLTLAASLIMGLMHTIFKFASLEGDIWTSIFWRSAGMLLVGLIIYVTVSSYRASFHKFFKQNKGVGISLNAGNEAFTLVGDTLFAFAILLAPIAVIQTVDSYQPFFILIITYFLVRFFPRHNFEDFSVSVIINKVIGITLVLAGSVMLLLNL